MSGTLFIVSAPSGAGKTTLVRELLAHDSRVRLSISYTTRAPRAGEQNGRDYHFVDVTEFLAMRNRGDFLESAEVHGNFYGTSRVWLEREIAAGRDALLEIDWQGAQQVRRFFGNAIGIFIMPPSLAELERRLRGRGTDDDETIARRHLAALTEMRHVGEFEYVIINNELAEAIGDLVAAVHASRLRLAPQQARHPELFSILFQEN
jgi:guanylate kinase